MLNHFNFKVISRNRILISNDFGEHAFLDESEFRCLIKEKFDKESQIYKFLRNRKFIVSDSDLLVHDVMQSLRCAKRYVFNATSLHIFILCGSCNLRCTYCQAQSHGHAARFMTSEVARRSVDIALQSPAKNLTFEFQGGEPLLNIKVLKEIVEYTKIHKGNHDIEFTVVSNLSLLTNDILDFLMTNDVSISTSLDGPKELHDYNRCNALGKSSYEMLMGAVGLIRKRGGSLSAIQTTTRKSLEYARKIVREYQALGLNGIFLRPLTPLGFANKEWKRIGYSPEEYLAFYAEAFDEVLRVNREGTRFPEQMASIFLQKILARRGINYMDLRSPCGSGIGQLAYYYDGRVFTCDEGRMVAESGDDAFLLGDVYSSSYSKLVSNANCDAVCAASVTESLPGCCDCVYQPYCGVCPVVNYALQGDVFPRLPNNYRCKIYGGILDLLFNVISEADELTMRILESWIGIKDLT